MPSRFDVPLFKLGGQMPTGAERPDPLLSGVPTSPEELDAQHRALAERFLGRARGNVVADQVHAAAQDPLLQRRDRLQQVRPDPLLARRDALMENRVEKRQLDPASQLAQLDAQIAALQAQRAALAPKKGKK